MSRPPPGAPERDPPRPTIVGPFALQHSGGHRLRFLPVTPRRPGPAPERTSQPKASRSTSGPVAPTRRPRFVRGAPLRRSPGATTSPKAVRASASAALRPQERRFGQDWPRSASRCPLTETVASCMVGSTASVGRSEHGQFSFEWLRRAQYYTELGALRGRMGASSPPRRSAAMGAWVQDRGLSS